MATKAKELQDLLTSGQEQSFTGVVYETAINTTKGINVGKIKNIQSALESYKKNVNDKGIKISAGNKKIEAAMKGQRSIEQFKQAQKNLQAAIKELMNFVTHFIEVLDVVKQNYQQHDESVTYNFGTQDTNN